MKKIFTFLLLLNSALSGLLGQNPQLIFEEGADYSCKWTLTTSKLQNIKVGEVITLTFKGKPAAGWHLYAAKEEGEIAYRPTQFELFDDESKGVKQIGTTKDGAKPKEEFDDLMGGIIRKFKDGQEVTFIQKVKITGTTFSLKGQLSPQICKTDGFCKFVPFEVSWEGSATKAVTENPSQGAVPCDTVYIHDTLYSSGDTNAVTPPINETNTPVITKSSEGKGGSNGIQSGDCSPSSLWYIFWISFAGGLIALLTPCVYPMIPLTVTFFVKQSKNRAQGIRNAIIYALSIIFVYVVVGLLITLIFGEEALYRIASNPIANIAFFLIFFVFALSFLGMFEIRLPNSWANKMDQRSQKGGLLGIFFMALTLVIVSFSCTGPIMGSVLVNAFENVNSCFWTPVAGMLGFGVAFAIPFGLFALFPGLLQSMPKSGGWLNTLKVVLGFFELALCLKFFSNMDLVWHVHLMDRQIFIGIWIVLAILLGIYLLGKLRLPHDSPLDVLPIPRLVLAIISFSFALYLLPGLWGGPLSALEGIIPPPNKNIGVKLLPHQFKAEGSINSEICKIGDRKYLELYGDREAHGYCMFYDLDEALAFAKEKKMPLFLDFTGNTCANCRKMEADVWPQPAIRSLLENKYVMVSLYADEPMKLDKPIILKNGKKLRTVQDKVLHLQKSRYGSISQPMYALMDYDGTDLVSETKGYTPDIKTYEAFLEKGIEAFKQKHNIKE